MLTRSYIEIQQRLKQTRSWADGVTAGNRCALVIGQAIRVKPKPGHTTFRGLDDANEHVRNMPFLDKFFVKAQDLANVLDDEWFEESEKYPASELVPRHQCIGNIEAIDGRKGVIFLQDCWKTPSEKMLSWIIGDKQTGDHIDLWNGNTLEIYADRSTSIQMIRQSKHVWFWESPDP